MGIFDIVHGEHGDSIVLNGMRIIGPSYEAVPKVTLDKLRAENAKLCELVRVILSDMDAWQMVIANGDTGYGKGCLERLYDLRDQAHELGVEVDG